MPWAIELRPGVSTMSFIVNFLLSLSHLLISLSSWSDSETFWKSESLGLFDSSSTQLFPDLTQYVHSKTLIPSQGSPDSRIIVVGDVHGMNKPFRSLLSKLDYKPEEDTLVHVGDVVTKGSLKGSLAVLSYLSSNNITGVRGNHDQVVIQWRAWLDWIMKQKGGKAWLERVEKMSEKRRKKYFKTIAKSSAGQIWQSLPDHLDFTSDHYKIARAMTSEDYEYLRNLPLILHVPSIHGFVVHAGMLPLNPQKSTHASKQPLAHLPAVSKADRHNSTALHFAQERALLFDIPQNKDLWTLTNIRGIMKNNGITRDKDGVPWADIWNSYMGRCGGFDMDISEQNSKALLPCMPSTVIYGHTASRGLDLRGWTKGIDTGCVYGNKLTALVISKLPSQSTSLNSFSDQFSILGRDFDLSRDGYVKHMSVKC